jgi:CheY-like chemotaxis protein
LVAEDEDSIATMLCDALEDEGYDVTLARDGREALDRLRTSPPALVITDLMMPYLDGLELCRAMQADPAYHAIPVIVMSAIEAPQATDGCQYAAFLKKPFDLQVVLDTITKVIELTDHA